MAALSFDDLEQPQADPADQFADRILQSEHSHDDQVSPKGAQAAYQVMPRTQVDPGFGVTPAKNNTPEEIDREGRDYAKALYNHYGNPVLAAAAYNAGPGNTDSWIKKYGDPRSGKISDQDFVNKIPSGEAKAYAANYVPSSATSGPLTFDDVAPGSTKAAAGAISFDDLAPPQDAGLLGTIKIGLINAARDVGQGIKKLSSDILPANLPPGYLEQFENEGAPAAVQPSVAKFAAAHPEIAAAATSPAVQAPITAQQPIDWSKPLDPKSVTEKMAYDVTQMVPMVVGAMGGIPGAAIAVGTQSLGQNYQNEIQKTPNDPAGATKRAYENSAADAAITALSFKAFEYMPFKTEVGSAINDVTGEVAKVYQRTVGDLVKNLATQGLGIQGAISVADQGIHNWINGRPLTEGMPNAYAQGAIPTTLMLGVAHIISPSLPQLGAWRPPAAGETTPYNPSGLEGQGPIIDQGGGPGGFRPGGAGAAAQLPAPPPPAGSDIGLRSPDGSIQRATVERYGANGSTVIVRYEDGSTTEHLTSEVMRDRAAPPPPRYEAEPEPAKPYQRQLGPDEGKAPPFGEAPPDEPSARAMAKIAGRQPQPMMDPQAIHALDLADRLEGAATDPGNPMSTADRMAALMQVARLRQQFTPEGEESRPGAYKHPLAAEPAKDMGPLAAARTSNAPLYQGEPPAHPLATEPASDLGELATARQARPELYGQPQQGTNVSQMSGVPSAALQPEAVEHDHAAATTDTNPTPAQIEAGNYKHGKITISGIPVSIETPRNAVRSGIGANGQPWENQNPLAHYGYITRVGQMGTDGEQIDAYVGQHPNSPIAYIVDQVDPKTGSYDESKAILGAKDEQDAKAIYNAGFSDNSGPSRMGAITKMPMVHFKDWLKNGDLQRPLNAMADPDYQSALWDVRDARSKAKTDRDILGTVIAMGGIRLTNNAGATTPEGQAVRDIVNDYHRPGLINNRSGMTPDYLREALTEQGWFGDRDAGQSDVRQLYDLLDRAVRGQKVHHPESDANAILERRALTDEEMGRAGVLSTDSHADAAKKLLDFRRQGIEELAIHYEKAADEEVEKLSPGAIELLTQYGYEPGADYGAEHEEIEPQPEEPQRAAETGREAEPQRQGQEHGGAGAPEPARGGEAAAQEPSEPSEVKETFQQYNARLKAERDTRAKEVSDAFEADGRVVGHYADQPNKKLLLTRGTDQAPFRVTSIDEHGPSGHRDYNSFDEAVREFLGKVNIEPPRNVEPSQERYAAGKALTKEQRKSVLASLTDVYKENNLEKVSKGQDRRGEEMWGYPHSPDLFRKSDITNAMVRYYVTMPDGRIAHPTELFPDYTVSDIEAEMARRKHEERVIKGEVTRYTKPDLQFGSKADLARYWNEKSAQSKVENGGRHATIVPQDERATFTDGKSFISMPKFVGERGEYREALAEMGWRQEPIEGQRGFRTTPGAIAAEHEAEVSHLEAAGTKAAGEKHERLPEESVDLGRGVEAKQAVIPGAEQSAKQLAQAREASGHGRIKTKTEQKEPAGLFEAKAPAEPDMFATPVARRTATTAGARIPPREPEMLTDVGEKIGGARKDKWAERGLRVSDLEGMSEGEAFQHTTKDQVWPKPDYEKMVASGVEPKAAAYIKIIRDRLAAKPSVDSAEGRRNYIEMMGHVREALSGAKTEQDVRNARDAIVYEHAGVSRNRLGTSEDKAAREKLFSVYKDRQEPFGVRYADARKADKMIADGFPGKAEPWTRRFGVRKRGNGQYDVTEKNGYRPLSEPFDTKEEAEAQASKLYDAALAEGGGNVEPKRPHLDKIERTGKDIRNGRDVTGDDFIKDFGFRGIEFGNWVASDERQKAVNLAYDGLHDLAGVIGVPPETLSLDGHLGLAFGARGSGKFAAHYEPGRLVINLTKLSGAGSLAHEWAHALDHYFGTLDTGETTHGEPKGASGWYKKTEQRVSHLKNLRPAMAESFDKLMGAIFKRDKPRAEAVRAAELRLEDTQAAIAKQEKRVESIKDDKANQKFIRDSRQWIKAQQGHLEAIARRLAELRDETKPYIPAKINSSYYDNAIKLSGKSGSDGYWARPTEMFARAFEGYVFDKLEQEGNKSQYLVQGVEPERYEEGYKGNPYPTGMERKAIDDAFDHIFKTMEVREGAGGRKILAQRPALDQTKTPEFKRWFGDSKVVDGDGAPAVMFHGSSADIPRFDRSQSKDGAFHFGTAAQAGMRVAGEGKNLIPVFLRIENPRRSVDTGDSWKPRIAAAKAAGNDGIVYLNRYEGIPTARIEALQASGDLNKIESMSDAKFRKLVPEAKDSYIAFEPEQIKSAIGNRGTFDPNNPDIRAQAAKPFFSALTRGVDSIKQEKAPGAQWSGIIDNLKSKGVKQDEIDWSGVKDWLAAQKGPVSKADLLEHLRENEVQVQEVEKGAPPQGLAADAAARQKRLEEAEDNFEAHLVGTQSFAPRDARDFSVSVAHDDLSDAQRRGIALNPEEARLAAELRAAYAARLNGDYEAAKANLPEFASYTLPGGQNYREMVLTLPPRGRPEAKEIRLEPFTNRNGGRDYHTFVNGQPFVDIGASESEPLATERVRRLWNDPEHGAMGYVSPHWDERNVLAHIRFDDRSSVTPGFVVKNTKSGNTSDAFETRGEAESYQAALPKSVRDQTEVRDVKAGTTKKVLHVAEIQSDWHQAGRKRGYEGANLSPETKRLIEEVKALGLTEDPRHISTAHVAQAGGSPELQGRWFDALQRGDLRPLTVGVPNAPFKTSWHELAMKRMLRYAAENGYDRLSWDTGDTNAARYDLSKQVDAISWNPKTQKMVIEKDGVAHDVGVVPKEKLPDHIGKEAANKIVDQRVDKDGDHVLQGEGLKVGGEGMRGFYDKILPDFARKYVKKWGAKVEDTHITGDREHETPYRISHDGNDYWVEDRNGNAISKKFDTAIKAMDARDGMQIGPRVHSIDITPAMKESVMAGQPLFQKGEPVPVSDKTGNAQVIAPGLIAKLPARPSHDEARLIEQINLIARQIVPTATVIPARELMVIRNLKNENGRFEAEGQVIWGATYVDGPRQLIAWSLGGRNPKGTLRHEVIHYLRNLGFFTPKEWSVLANAAIKGNWIQHHDIVSRYPDQDLGTHIEEAVAEESGAWEQRETTPPPEVRSLFGRLRNLLSRVGKYLRSLFGKDVTAEDIFRKVMSGEIGSREPQDKWKPPDSVFAQAAKTPEGPVETPAEGRDYIDATTQDLAEHMRSKGPGTYERTLQGMAPKSGPEIFANAGKIKREFISPRTMAEVDTKSGKFWAAIQREEDEAGQRLHGLRDDIRDNFLKLPRENQDRVNAVMELDRLDNRTRSDDGRSIIARNTGFADARGSKPGDSIILSPAETKAYYGLQRMYRQAWDNIMEGSARRMGWQRTWSPSMQDNFKSIERAISEADGQRNRKAFQRIHDILSAMEEQRRAAYMPLMRFGDYYFSVTPKYDKESTGGFPESVWFSLAERPSFQYADANPVNLVRFETTQTGHVPDYAKGELAGLQGRFNPKDYRINHGYLLAKPDMLRQMSIPAIEKLMMLLESGVMDRLKTESSMEGFANKGAAFKKAKEDWGNLYEELVDAVRDEMYEQLKAGFKKRSRTVAGYSGDWNRALGSYMGWTSKHVAKQIHGDDVERLYDDIQTSHPHQYTRDFWRDWKKDDDDPTSPLSRVGMAANQIGFMWTMAMNPASTFSIMMHGPTYAIPTLGTGIGVPKAAAAFAKAYGEATAAIRWDAKHGAVVDTAKLGQTPDERAYIKNMESSGYLHAKGADDIRSMTEKSSAIWGEYTPHAQQAMDIASSNIAVADQANRVAAALAAYRLARDGNLGHMNAIWGGNQMWRAISEQEGVSPESMGKFLLNQSVGEWGGRSRSKFGRSFMGRMGTSLHGFVIRFISNMIKQATRQGLPGRISLAWTMAGLWAILGLQGLPEALDVENGIDWIWKFFTKHDPMVAWRLRAMLVDTGLGKLGADIVMRGPLSTATGIDFGSRLGLGDLVGRDVAPWVGMADQAALTFPSIVVGAIKAFRAREASHQPASAAASLLPGALRHPVQAVIDAEHGVKSQSGKHMYVPARKFTTADEAKEAAGFTPVDVARARERAEFQYQAAHAHGRRPRQDLPP